ncbi:PREDICTED: 2-acylglycerol O-acyltransferase 3 [Miniopterus natalensis]|uniref:2-acylglycerol O-acyltransferase 3 n=1 Tax=Miniopterus natalensis TaxID=291302 RepID=UPI0007A6BBD7|nr:PREDICTED: 2-acylglycerol O-acyltransferase 3 [Miniopterus natalensis]
METLQKQWLEAVCAHVHGFIFLFVGLFSFLLDLSLLSTPLWSLSVLCLAWLFPDWDKPRQGGCWKGAHVVSHGSWVPPRPFPPLSLYPKLVKTAELPPDRNYVFGSHPHGIMGIGTFCNFSTKSTSFSQQFPGPSVITLDGLFHLPVYRDYFMSTGLCSVKHQSLDFILSQPQLGKAIVIVVGGAQESLYALPGEHHLILKNHKGFTRLVLRHGASLVPVYSFGENDIYRHKVFATDSWQYLWQTIIKKLLGFAPCIFWGRSLFSANSWVLLPFPVPITTVVGHPVLVPQCLHPTNEEVDPYHTLYMKALEQLRSTRKL